jgi:hypothetical protein
MEHAEDRTHSCFFWKEVVVRRPLEGTKPRGRRLIILVFSPLDRDLSHGALPRVTTIVPVVVQ